MAERYEETRQRVAALARDAFRDHVLTNVGPGEWFCAKPRTGNHSFNLIVRPGVVMFWGDTGDWILSHNDRDSLAWLKRAAANERYPDYPLSKVCRGVECFYPGDATDHIRSLAAESEPGSPYHEILDEIAELGEVGDLEEHEFQGIVYNKTLDSELCSVGMNHPQDMLWLWEALCTFVRLLPAATESEGS